MENVLDWTPRVLATTPLRWQSLAQALPLELLTRRPAAGQWSALECLRHLLDSETIYRARITYLRAGQDFADFNPDLEGTPLEAAASPQALAAQFASQRHSSLEALAAIIPADLNCRARHSALGLVTLGEMVHVWAAHDLQHTLQAERALIQPFILGSGPWRANYQEQLFP